MLNIEPGLLIWTIITFILLVFVLRKVAWNPLLSALEQRESAIRESLEESQRARPEAQALLEQNQRQLAEANRESARIIEQGREEAERVKASIIDQSRQEGQRMVEDARRQIGQERQAAIQDLKSTAADLALQATQRLLSTSVTSEDHRRLVTEFLDRFPESVEN
jgi:F-type H+-transporting ATPase subunit b